MTRLFEHAPVRHQRSKCTDLVPRSTDACLACGGPTRELKVGQLPLLRHGGYGAVQTTVFRLCETYECRAVRVACVVETTPR